MAHDHRHKTRAEFADTDLAGIVHFARYVRWAEEAEHAFLRSLGLSVHTVQDGAVIGFPRAAVRCEYSRPIRFEDEVEVHIWVRRKGTRSLTYQFTISRGGEEAARGEIRAISCICHPDGRMEAAALPRAFAERLEEAPYPPLEFR
jgi:YbgC/YbaW family acyl-CoA thioester hydrolase